MSDASSIPEGPFEEFEGPPPSGKPSLLADPVVRYMVYALIGLIILFLVSAIGVLLTGVLATSGPRSAVEQRLLVASAGGTTGAAAVPYIEALVAAGDLPAARLALAQARGSLSATASPAGLDLMEARILQADEDYAKSVTLADKAMKGYQAAYDAKIAAAGKAAETTMSISLSPDYYNASLVKAYALVELSRWKEAVAAFDAFIRVNPTASDVLIDRGYAKIELKDNGGAEKDLRAGLRFVPYDQRGIDGLKKIGVAQ
jgi:tetratricopeptide (TPR) repeat protein